ncbi:MAG TPA: tetratricopeptide repeat protein [Amycolatopsis sp.]|uniref:tetratricopeptide repeat protein n=1 Tax=Amycolatopsis sp. TaxID=37632 RepID=UPI002B4A9BC6|nr:tetratricopeptide repeat protein [Amycolatopsis sp.]HKS48438.1 tetratricopeptide repeat protein [Amycolatopsis sp.]
MGVDEDYKRRMTIGHATGSAEAVLPVVRLPSTDSLIMSDPALPEGLRKCGKCGAGAGHDGTEGRCDHCGTPFSFSPKLTAGDLVAGQYEVLGCIARGGLGWIYLARDRHLGGKYVVLKGLINTADPAAVRLSVNESQVLTASEHPNIVRIFNVVTHADPHVPGEQNRYIVMDYVGGLSLREVVGKARAGTTELRVEHVIAYGREILAALAYLHAQGLLYCDMKPDNVIHGETLVKVIDLGAIREIGDRTSPIVGTAPYQVGPEEIAQHWLSVRSDVHTVGVTLRELFSVSDASVSERIAFGVESFRRVLDRATDHFAQRYGSATEMATQLDGVLDEVLSLRDGEPRPATSSVFTETGALLDAGLGQAPPLDRWTSDLAVPLTDGRPSAQAVARGLPVPVEDPRDPQTPFLRTVRAPDPARLLDKLARLSPSTVETEFRRCRVHLERGDPGAARSCLADAKEILGARMPYDWRMIWHRALLSLAENKVRSARELFDEVYWNIPGEPAPKLALGFCAETLGAREDAERYYTAVWTRDRSEVSAAFGLARVSLARGDRARAVRVLDQVPEFSRHYDAAMVAAVRVLSTGLAGGETPTPEDLNAAMERLSALYLDSEESRERLVISVREMALHLGCRSERRIREQLEHGYQRLARQARSQDEHGLLVDLANQVRPRSWT